MWKIGTLDTQVLGSVIRRPPSRGGLRRISGEKENASSSSTQRKVGRSKNKTNFREGEIRTAKAAAAIAAIAT